jgi:peptidoglycan/xylan/chitin deacetylase (PgdA/CDA1 family)
MTYTDNLVINATGVRPRLMRPAYGSRNTAVLNAVGSTGKAAIIWNKDTLDWKYRDAARLTSYLLNNAQDGDIILMHDIHATTVNGVIAALPLLKARGFNLVTVSQLMQIKGIALVNGAQYFSAR